MSENMDSRISLHYLDLVAWATRELKRKGLTPNGTSGDVSMRDPQTGLIYVTGSMLALPFPHNNLGCYRAQDMAVFEPDGTKITPWSKGTIESPMHLAIYRARPDVHAVVHSHPLWSSAFAIARKNMPLVLAEQCKTVGGEVVVAPYAPAGEMIMGDYIVEALGDKNTAIMANHGAVAVGPTFDIAFKNSDFLEAIAQKVLFARQLGELYTLKPDEINAKKFMEGTYIPKKVEESQE
jgi:L-fuculose-phosphate aldolase